MSDEIREILTHGEITVEARFANSSNATLLVTVELEGTAMQAVYKPEQGERPLWDFPSGLWRREVAAWVVSESLALDLVPCTVERGDDAPFGPGSLQRFVDEDEENHYFTLRDDPLHAKTMRDLAAFDVVTNNSDRKSGHVLHVGGRLWAIDHGLCFHEENKLRTVIWDFAGDELGLRLRESLERFRHEPPTRLGELISPEEFAQTLRRATALLEAGSLPFPDEEGDYPPYPWPLV